MKKILIVFFYILSGTLMPNRAIPERITLATDDDINSLNPLRASFSSFKIEKSW